MDEELSRFDEIVKDVDVSRRARRQAKRLASANRYRGMGPIARATAWARHRATTQSRPWAA